MSDRFSLERSLAGSSHTLVDAVSAIGRPRSDLAGLPLGATAWAISRALHERADQTLLVIAATREQAESLREDIRFFAGPDMRDQILAYPATDTSPFVDIAPDRRAAMDRLTTLFALAHAQPVRCVVAPIAAVCRRVPPRRAVRKRSLVVEHETELSLDTLTHTLAAAGYLRAPVVEDPGSFAVRGALVDVFPPNSSHPCRIELDFDMVLSIKRFDPDDQRSLDAIERVALPPVRNTMVDEGELDRACQRISDLCDHINLPTSRRKALVEDIRSGRAFLGLEGFMPAFYEQVETLFDYLPQDTTRVVVDPTAAIRALDEELERASGDRGAKVADNQPAYELRDHYLISADLADALRAGPLCVCHRLAVGGGSVEEGELIAESAMSFLEDVDEQTLVRAQAEDHTALRNALKAKRSQTAPGKDGPAATGHPLSPLIARVERWLSEGLSVFVCARTETQAERLQGLLSGHGLVAPKPGPFEPRPLHTGQPPGGEFRIVIGGLQHGFVMADTLTAFVTEDEIFGLRARRTPTARKGRNRKRAFVEDLRQLQVGDFVVHVEHGIGRYLGLGRQEVPVSRYEQLQGRRPQAVEVLEVEYAGGDKLYLPVTRLNQIEKFAGAETKRPKLDKLGGQTFARTKKRVERSVKQLADELLALYAARAAQARPAYPPADANYAEFEATFPYEETEDQRHAIDDMLEDLVGDRPMDRLVCGDVGFGKTEVALRAAFRAAMSGRQVAVLCPTTVLAQQHLRTFDSRLRDYPVRVEVLSRFVPKKQQGEVVKALREGQCDIVIGTHRLLSKDVHFKQLGLLIIDEEQRFGVTHKERIKKLRTEVDVLTLSATPIPRTLQLAIGGLRELSLITTPPVDRRAVRTFVTRWQDHVVREGIERELARGGQVFFINNRIERLYERAAEIQALIPDAKVATVHGRLRENILEQVMTDFVDGRYDILCSTALVENGLDIPRANTILIDRADMFGLSQLYQLRGRVGRSRERAYCYLLAPAPGDMSDEARTRIEALERFNQLGSGFQLASMDMELRGAGDLLGAEQSGNVAAVGFELFAHMLEEAVAELRGQPRTADIDPELTVTAEHYLPDDYVSDVGVRLSLYKRLASAADEAEAVELGEEMEERFGPPPEPARRFIRLMTLKPQLRALRVLGCEASSQRVTLHFEDKTPIEPARLARLVAASRQYGLTPDMKLTRRFTEEDGSDPIEHVQALLFELTDIE